MGTLPLFDRQGAADDDGQGERERVYRVSEINRAVRVALEGRWGDVWVEGELSDVTRAASGHVYFSLADEKESAQLRGVMFRGDARRAKARLANGQRVRLRGGLSLYEARGSFQLIARIALPAGEGDLQAQFERIRQELEEEGLFAPERKRPLPRFPRVVGVVTSKSGAAMHDVVRVARGRCPVRLVVADCRVQGEAAPATIVKALENIQRLPELDVVIITRGGGSAEELWSFNDERVARAIAACRVPTVSGVGHEVDVTIADLVADTRASTPSNAAELVVPDRRALELELRSLRRRLDQGFDTHIGRERLRLERVARRLSDPRHTLGGARRRLGNQSAALERLTRRRLASLRARVEQLARRLSRHDPRTSLARDRRRLDELRSRLRVTGERIVVDRRHALAKAHDAMVNEARPLIEARRRRLERTATRLDALSPLRVLSRGYAIALHEPTGQALVSAANAAVGDRVEVRLADGSLSTVVQAISSPTEEGPVES